MDKQYEHLPKRILVTGGAGFIGSHTVDLLLAQGCDVVVLDDLSAGKLENLNLSHPNLEFIEGNVLEFPFLKELLESCQGVLHLAAIVSVPFSIDHPILTLQVNTQGCLHVLEAVRVLKKNIRIVYASSAAVYGNPSTLPSDDNQQVMDPALSPYGLQKINAEQYAALFKQLSQVSSLGLRYFNVYGLRQDPNSPYSGVISQFIKNYQQDIHLTIFGDGQQTRDFIHVSDVARANALALCARATGTMNIATGNAVSLLHLIQCIEKVGGRPAKIKYEAARVGDIKDSSATTSKAFELIGFRAEKTLLEGLTKMPL